MISNNVAKKIFTDATIPEGTSGLARNYKLASSRSQRLACIRASADSIEGQSSAAMEIQRYFRGYSTRCRLMNIVAPKSSVTAIYSGSKHHVDRLQDVESPSRKQSAAKSDAGEKPKRTSVWLYNMLGMAAKATQGSVTSASYIASSSVSSASGRESRGSIFSRRDSFSVRTRSRISSWAANVSPVVSIRPSRISETDILAVHNEMDEIPSTPKDRLKAKYQGYVQAMMNQGLEKDNPLIVSFEDFCAHIIQDWWLRIKPSARIRSSMVMSSSVFPSVIVQKSSEKISMATPDLTEHEAASRIQRGWRRHIDIQVFAYYRDLINFKARGDPGMMLRCINPNEAKYLDPAAGVHIKFRLAGERFPPNIYYRIFTHRPIQDMCANSPKDYTKACNKRKMAKDLHNKVNRCNDQDDKAGWYKRIENNGWRLVSDRLITHMMADPITWESSQKKVEFHHSKVHRRQDVDKRRKRKKIAWMKKMYRDGLLKARVDDPETVELIDGAAAGMIATVDQEGPNAVQEWEVDELLEWTTSLNYDDYLGNWKETATSAKSEKTAETKARIFTAVDKDPFTLQMSESISKLHADNIASYINTPVSEVRVPH